MYSKSTNQFGLNIIILLYMIQSLDILQCSQTGVFVMQVKHEVRDSISYVNSMLSTALFDVDVDCPCLTRNSDICVHFCTTIPALSVRPQSFSLFIIILVCSSERLKQARCVVIYDRLYATIIRVLLPQQPNERRKGYLYDFS